MNKETLKFLQEEKDGYLCALESAVKYANGYTSLLDKVMDKWAHGKYNNCEEKFEEELQYFRGNIAEAQEYLNSVNNIYSKIELINDIISKDQEE